ncbi:MAG: PAS domain S-box protein [Hylemonella sp.]|uniref:PAS domain-containing sensor histidine kinase n=1 Tax=Hylemonella sp. TaxID=2066020 RepID=UPI0022BC2696|nr:PAS domain-containing sensor histidine kinase [Hylemonella sp.]MCZ8251390.1 PAS domain S-box protein [Hylemonella sp.]
MLHALKRLLPRLRELPAAQRLRSWWRQQSPHRQDRYAMLAPLVAVLLFFAAIVAAFGYLRLEEMEREQEAVRRDVEYAQQRVRLRLLERQEELVRLAQQVSNQELDAEQFRNRANVLLNQYPELQGLSWVDERLRLRASQGNATLAQGLAQGATRNGVRPAKPTETENAYALARELRQPIYVQRAASPDGTALLELHLPLHTRTSFAGVVLAEYSLDTLYRYGVPAEVSARYAVSLRDSRGEVLAGSSAPRRNRTGPWMGWATHANEYEVPVSPVGNGLVLHAQAYRASLGVIGSGLFWLVGTLSVMTAWMLIANWRHTRRRMQAQQALVLETNFRRAMENSMPTGMRALDLQGRITYVNTAFCQMTGWSERELVGCTAPFPYWPEEDREMLAARLEDELTGRVTPGGFQVRVKRKDGTLFDARIYVSPLIDARGLQTGWMTSMTDITEPNRVREQLYASYERFTTVLEALDASVSVAPLGSDELLFANKMYRLWFSDQSRGHALLSSQAGVPPRINTEDSHDAVDGLVGMPTSSLPDAEAENAELYAEELGKWLEVRTRYLTWVDGRLAQMVIATDITPRRLAEAQAAAQAERAQTASRLITMGEMASSVAHELNQPLTAINNYCNGMVSRIKSKQISEDDLLGALEKTAKQAQRAGQIIQRIRAFVKRSEPNRTPSEVAVMVSEAVELAEIELRRYNVRLSHYTATLPPLVVDPILIEQVLVNLLKNAAEAIVQAQRPPQERRVELQVLPATVEGRPVVEFTVTDTGRGIPPEVMERLYEAFHTTKAEGMGIGLSLCRSIVESHQGRMKAENLYNGSEVTGCRFSFWLPMDGKPTEATKVQAPTEKMSG